MRCSFLGYQLADDTHVAGDRLVGGAVDEVSDLGRELLAIAVDPAIALLKSDERPREVEVNQVVALLVQVHAFRGDV